MRVTLTVVALAAVGCSGGQHSGSSFQQASVEECLRHEGVVFISAPRGVVSPELVARFPDVIGEDDILNGTGSPPPGQTYGPPIDGGHLTFEHNAAQARRDALGVYALLPTLNPLIPVAPQRLRRSFVNTRGNVIITWDYPNSNPALSMRLVAKCMPST